VGTAERIALGFVQAERLRRRNVPGAEVVDLDGLVLAFANVPDPELNSALVEREPLDPATALEAAEAEFTRRGLGFGIDLQAGRHPAVDGCLRSRGLEILLERPGMAADVSDLADIRPPRGVRITPVTDQVGALALAKAGAEAFDGDLESSERFYAKGAFGVSGAISFVAWQGDDPVGSAAGYLNEGAVGVFGVGVVPRARRRGLGAALTVAAVRAFDGADIAWLHPSEMAWPMYQALGFRRVSDWQVWARSSGL
jgi:Acetyltransferase (GNAT) family.